MKKNKENTTKKLDEKLKKTIKKCAKYYEKAYKKRKEIEDFCEELGLDELIICDILDVNLVHENTPEKFIDYLETKINE